MYIAAACIYHLKRWWVMIVKLKFVVHFSVCKQRCIVLFILFNAQIIDFIMPWVLLIKKVPRVIQRIPVATGQTR